MPEGRITPADAGIWNDAQAEAWGAIARLVKARGAAAGIQLAHAGRKASTDAPWRGGRRDRARRTAAGSRSRRARSPFADGYATPRALAKRGDRRDARRLRRRRAPRARRGLRRRRDPRGARLPPPRVPVAARERARRRVRRLAREPDALPARGRGTRSATRGRRTARSSSASRPPTGRRAAGTSRSRSSSPRRMRALGVDLVDCSSGGQVPHAKVPLGPATRCRSREAIRREAGIATGAVGLITEPAAGRGDRRLRPGRRRPPRPRAAARPVLAAARGEGARRRGRVAGAVPARETLAARVRPRASSPRGS